MSIKSALSGDMISWEWTFHVCVCSCFCLLSNSTVQDAPCNKFCCSVCHISTQLCSLPIQTSFFHLEVMVPLSVPTLASVGWTSLAALLADPGPDL